MCLLQSLGGTLQAMFDLSTLKVKDKRLFGSQPKHKCGICLNIDITRGHAFGKCIFYAPFSRPICLLRSHGLICDQVNTTFNIIIIFYFKQFDWLKTNIFFNEQHLGN